MKIFPGSSNKKLAESVAKTGDFELGEVKVSKFANGESRVYVEDGDTTRAAILQSLSTPVDEHIVEFALISDAITRMGVTSVTGVIPWLGYSKQDKVFRRGEPLSVKVVAQLLSVAKLKRIITFDLHNKAIVGFFDAPVIELSAKSLFLDYFREKRDLSDTVVVAPDAGSMKSSTEFAMELSVPTVYVDKKRDLETGKVSVVGVSGSVKNKDVLIVDDNIYTGSTLIETSKVMKKEGARSVRVGVTHHMWVPGVQEKLEKSLIDEIVVTDTVSANQQTRLSDGQVSEQANRRTGEHGEKLVILSVAPMIAGELSK